MAAAKKLYGYHLITILTVVIWGITFVSTKVLIGYGLSPAAILFYRFVLAYVGIWLFAPRMRLFAANWKDELLCVVAGLTGGSLYFVAENTALGHTLASNVSLIVSTTPVFTALLSSLLYKNERLGTSFVYGSLMALAGVALVVFNGSFILQVGPIGDILTLTAALMWAFYGMVVKRLDSRYPVLFITRKVFFYGVVTLLPVFYFTPLNFNIDTLMQLPVLLNLLFLGVIASLLCYIMWNTAVKQLGVVRTTNYVYIIPLITLFTSAIVIDERITYVALIGSFFILSGVYVAQKGFAGVLHLFRR